MAAKIGVYLCSGCGIGEVLDPAGLLKVAEADRRVALIRESVYFCGQDAGLIQGDVAEGDVDAVVLAACSPRFYVKLFDYGPGIPVVRVNLREQVAWCHEPGSEDIQMLAEDALRMGLARVGSVAVPEPFRLENPSRTILVVGGGLAGLTAALEAARAAYRVVLVERENSLGGWLRNVYRCAPLKPPYTELMENPIHQLSREVESHPGIVVYRGASIERTAGGPGLFDVTIRQGKRLLKERVGSIIVASGAGAYNPAKLTRLKNLAYGTSPDIIVSSEFEKLALRGGGRVARPSDGREARRIAFIQCAGSRDPEHLPYCSAACCEETLKQALYLLEPDPGCTVFIYYRDLRVSGQYEHFYRKVQEAGAVFIQGEVVRVADQGGSLSVEADDVFLGCRSRAEGLDLVVLATGMIPEAAGDGLEQGILKLDYRQGPELPALKYGFPDSHFICFPYETRRTGIYAAGSVREPMDLVSTLEDAAGAALKAIQCIEMTARGQALHPRALDISYPEFNMSRCTQCKRCTEECPFGAINEDAKSNPLPQITRCRRCGTCLGACPERIVSFKDFSVALVSSMIKSIEVPEEYEEKPRVLVFACENDAYPALDLAGAAGLKYNPWVRIIPLRCLGSLNPVWIADAMSRGIDGVLLMGCRQGEDYQCHFINGSELARTRIMNVSETLDRMGLEAGRVKVVEVGIMDYTRIPAILDGFAGELAALGPNPLKGF
ncbi:MAG TPA: FAD-dependent oxidoreductase [Bacillota bacterium]|jgi:quinone-modifying oxidoreductase subunit QmoB|nr:FAD-dependent oxidoreductase [Peptococcaceae bacterium MAG4]NLW36980.1 hydrogenase iron-sulfur subunit [Peptococcaceae bacterium]HPZ42688.1 FAD-dependent oxidoreductase [Bacillota bacterium]HQD75668.1 FAD-dependent oxidoreductase [Bacillota bacterium]HUM57938.1 FAD-dependent oxidoreductase [Bacillota bacterium]